MPISKPLQNFLEKNKIRTCSASPHRTLFRDSREIKYEVVGHKVVYTAHDKAATLRVKPEIVGKTMVMVFDKKNYMIGLIPANKNLNKKKLLKAVNIWLKKQKTDNSDGRFRIAEARRAKARYSHADFAKEAWMKKTFKGIDVGATPPFGALYYLPFFIDNALMKQTKIIVNGGKYNYSIKISPINLLKLNPPTLKGNFSQAKK